MSRDDGHVEQAVRRLGSSPTAEQRLADATRGDRRVNRLLSKAGAAIGMTITAAVNLLNPSRVMIAGELAEARSVLFDAINAAVLDNHARAGTRRHSRHTGPLGPEAAILGAATAVIRRALDMLVDAPQRSQRTLRRSHRRGQRGSGTRLVRPLRG